MVYDLALDWSAGRIGEPFYHKHENKRLKTVVVFVEYEAARFEGYDTRITPAMIKDLRRRYKLVRKAVC